MGEFFRRWRRKIGVATLLPALLMAVAWVRSLRAADDCVLAFGEISWEVRSKNGTLEIMLHRLFGGVPVTLGIAQTSWECYEFRPLPSVIGDELLSDIEWRYERKSEFCGLMFAGGEQQFYPESRDISFGRSARLTIASDEQPSYPDSPEPISRVKTSVIAFPYAYITMPLTLLAAFLLLIDPWRTRKPETLTNILN